MPQCSRRSLARLLPALALALSAACASEGPPSTESKSGAQPAPQPKSAGVVNVYSHRHYETDKRLFTKFEQETGISVRVVKAGADALIERLVSEGASSPADLLITADAGRLVRADAKGLLQPVQSEILEQAVPENLRHPDGHWFGLTQRARVIVYNKERVQPSELSTYAALTEPAWKGRVLVRSSANMYNQSLLASMIAHDGEAASQAWAEGVVSNMARPPKGSDRDQMKAVAAGVGDVAIVNTYYVGLLVNSKVPEERAVGEQMGVFFPDQDGRGAHVNVSGAGVTRHAPNRDNAVQLLEFLVNEDSQATFAQANYEFPVRADVPAGSLLESWGDFKADALPLSNLGMHQETAVRVFDAAGWR
ncbi:MAG: Fe(3+) ABC transporter substrate-binding protein [Deltaproteobacteria bacterium]|nr:Fe(3+) ABC transporter substrate-binding protein [Deltaproteobacteria bacterium]HCH65438.1 Fe(3+) ABC transporter substrate-binding protein [Deltaproteobacteria bacterium]